MKIRCGFVWTITRVSVIIKSDKTRIGDEWMIAEGLIDVIGSNPKFLELAVILSILYYVALIVAQFKLFIKAGEKGWKALIPFYNMFVSHHLIGMRHFWFILDIIFWTIEVALEFTHAVPLWVEETILTVALLFTIISEIIHIMKLCYCYAKNELFGIGMFILSPVFSLILAFGKSQYRPPRSHREHNEAKT